MGQQLNGLRIVACPVLKAEKAEDSGAVVPVSGPGPAISGAGATSAPGSPRSVVFL